MGNADYLTGGSNTELINSGVIYDVRGSGHSNQNHQISHAVCWRIYVSTYQYSTVVRHVPRFDHAFDSRAASKSSMASQ